jgi:endonuclease/exonuclease/phosphatase family metal-dependent hydrolase
MAPLAIVAIAFTSLVLLVLLFCACCVIETAVRMYIGAGQVRYDPSFFPAPSVPTTSVSTLKLLTLNTYQIPVRRHGLVSMIRLCQRVDADVIVLQEMWSLQGCAVAAHLLRDSYVHVLSPNNYQSMIGSGLFVASKSPLVPIRFESFRDVGAAPDFVSRKGYLLFDTMGWRVVATHLAWYPHSIVKQQLVQLSKVANVDVVAGDLNTCDTELVETMLRGRVICNGETYPESGVQLDYIVVTNKNIAVTVCEVISAVGISDHNGIYSVMTKI